jgi:hypothetical protein
MHKARKTILVVLFIALAALVVLTPYAVRTIGFHWAKSSVRRTFDKFTPEECRNLNAVPTAIVLPPTELNSTALDQLDLGDFTLRIPRPTRIDKKKSVLLAYPQYEVRIMRPTSTKQLDDVTRQLHFTDGFGEFSAAYHTRLSDLDNVHDRDALRRFTLLIDLRGVIRCREEFTRGDLRGFVVDSFPGGGKGIVAEVFQPSSQMGLGIWFTGDYGASLEHVHEFLSALEIKLAQPSHRNAATTAPDSRD